MTADASRRTSRTDSLGRYYTTAHASEVLVSQLRPRNPRRVLDLGSGAGALSLAARSAWKHAEIVTVDIDIASKRALAGVAQTQTAGSFRHFSVDALRPDLPELLGGTAALSDVAICNPPFIKPKWRKGFEDVLTEAGLDACYTSRHDVTADVLFLAQNLRLVRDAGHIGIIVPDSIIAGKKHSALRERLLASHRIESVIRLPRTAFAGTDAQGFVLTLTKDRPSSDGIEMRELRPNGKLSEPIWVDPKDAIVRLDFGYHSLHAESHGTRLRDVVLSVNRGNVASSKRFDLPAPAFHTTDFPTETGSGGFRLGRKFSVGRGPAVARDVVARAGDILLARVGRNLEKKICLVTSGSAVVTDCVYVIRVVTGQERRVFDVLSSERGRDWLASVSHGVSARQLPKCDLLEFPL
ncbi:N-6 DNA methylase [Paraburkholderia phenoliruptrix]|uniref:N-6 DNA methylase n=1 Tax=Paraburkholderia phenoliruptrix TaxID=252970 RepID=UPI002869A04E|nr:N-6 DNA methylase [Paraburkholderia phenoliruptrix]WMY08672.1 N-6 DNA methylase [Paraburkholderia phenoliruptrix]